MNITIISSSLTVQVPHGQQVVSAAAMGMQNDTTLWMSHVHDVAITWTPNAHHMNTTIKSSSLTVQVPHRQRVVSAAIMGIQNDTTYGCHMCMMLLSDGCHMNTKWA